MVQPKYNPKEALQRVKLLMNYDSKKTLTENYSLINEQPDFQHATEIVKTGPGMTEITPPPGAKRGYRYYQKGDQIFYLKPAKNVNPTRQKPKDGDIIELEPDRAGPKTKKQRLLDAAKWCTKNWKNSSVCIASFFIFGESALDNVSVTPDKNLQEYIGFCKNKKVPHTLPDKKQIEITFDPDESFANQTMYKKIQTAFDYAFGTDLESLGITRDWDRYAPQIIRDYFPGKAHLGVFNSTNPGGANTFERFCGVVNHWDGVEKKEMAFYDRLTSELDDSETNLFNAYLSTLIQNFILQNTTSSNTCPQNSNPTKIEDLPEWAKTPCFMYYYETKLGNLWPCFGSTNNVEFITAKLGNVPVKVYQNGKMSSNDNTINKKWRCNTTTKKFITEATDNKNKLIFEQEPEGGSGELDIETGNGGTTPPKKKDEFCPNGYKNCTNNYQKCCIAEKIKVMQKCLGVPLPNEGRWGPKTDAAYNAKFSSYKADDDLIDSVICFCPNGLKECSGTYGKCCASPKISQMKKCLSIGSGEVWGKYTQEELNQKYPKFANGFTDTDVERACRKSETGYKVINPQDEF